MLVAQVLQKFQTNFARHENNPSCTPPARPNTAIGLMFADLNLGFCCLLFTIRAMPKPADWKVIRKSLKKYLALENEFNVRFKATCSSRAKLKKEIMAIVTRSEWFTDLCYELDPMFFILGLREGKPARQLKREPRSKLGMVRYGFDAQNQLVHVEKCMAWDEYREHQAGRIDAARFHLVQKNCLDIQTLFLDGNQPVAHIESDNSWIRIKKYEYQGGEIVCVLTASKRNTGTNSDWSFGKYEILKKRYGIYDIKIELDNYKPGTTSVLRYFAPISTQAKEK